MNKKNNYKLTHIDEYGKASMVNVSEKKITKRIAIASSKISLNKKAYGMLKENKSKKGDILNISRIAGIMASKRTSELIPLCHQINLNKVDIDFSLSDKDRSIIVKSTTIASDKTGVEMEALMATSIASLTIYDMLKAVDKKIIISDLTLDFKDGGQSGKFVNY